MNLLPAAAVPEGAVVKIPDNTPVGDSFLEIHIDSIENNTPVAGKITWYDKRGLHTVIGAATRVEVISLP